MDFRTRKRLQKFVRFGLHFAGGVVEVFGLAWAIMILAGNLHALSEVVPAIGFNQALALAAWPFIIWSVAKGIAGGIEKALDES
jgi:hypothetical protein